MTENTENPDQLDDPTAPPELDDDVLAAAGLQRTVAYVKTGKFKKRNPNAERQARKRARDAEKGIVTKALATDDQEALDMGRAVQRLRGWRKKLVMRWIRD